MMSSLPLLTKHLGSFPNALITPEIIHPCDSKYKQLQIPSQISVVVNYCLLSVNPWNFCTSSFVSWLWKVCMSENSLLKGIVGRISGPSPGVKCLVSECPRRSLSVGWRRSSRRSETSVTGARELTVHLGCVEMREIPFRCAEALRK